MFSGKLVERVIDERWEDAAKTSEIIQLRLFSTSRGTNLEKKCKSEKRSWLHAGKCSKPFAIENISCYCNNRRCSLQPPRTKFVNSAMVGLSCKPRKLNLEIDKPCWYFVNFNLRFSLRRFVFTNYNQAATLQRFKNTAHQKIKCFHKLCISCWKESLFKGLYTTS